MYKGIMANKQFLLPILAIVGSALITSMLVVNVPSLMAAKKPVGKAFPSSEKCKRCHLRVFEEWEASAQSRSIVSAPFRLTLERYIAQADEKNRAMCFQCHAPHITEYPELLPQFIKEVQSKDPHMDGVGCPQCHLIHDVDATTHPPVRPFN